MGVSAIIGGVLFVLFGFSSGGVSAQMGGSFIGAYAFYFIELYYANKRSPICSSLRVTHYSEYSWPLRAKVDLRT